MRNLRIVFDENLALKYQIAAVQKKATGDLINIVKISKFISRKTRALLSSDTFRFLQRIVIWTDKCRFAWSSNDS